MDHALAGATGSGPRIKHRRDRLDTSLPDDGMSIPEQPFSLSSDPASTEFDCTQRRQPSSTASRSPRRAAIQPEDGYPRRCFLQLRNVLRRWDTMPGICNPPPANEGASAVCRHGDCRNCRLLSTASVAQGTQKHMLLIPAASLFQSLAARLFSCEGFHCPEGSEPGRYQPHAPVGYC